MAQGRPSTLALGQTPTPAPAPALPPAPAPTPASASALVLPSMHPREGKGLPEQVFGET